jgi:hypothetical protein
MLLICEQLLTLICCCYYYYCCYRNIDQYSAVGFQDLSPALQREVQQLQQRMATELQPLQIEQSLTMQKILEAEDHTERLKLVRFFITAEKKRLNTKRALQGMFSGDSAAALEASIPTEEQIAGEEQLPSEDSMKVDKSSSSSSSIFTDDADAFQ